MVKRTVAADSGKEQIVGHVSVRSIVRSVLGLALLGVGVYALVLLHQIVILLLLGLFIATVMHPSVQRLRRWRVPVRLGIALHYLVFLTIASYLVITLIPVVGQQLGSIANTISQSAEEFTRQGSVSIPLLSPKTNFQLTQLIKSALRNLSIASWTDALEQAARSLATVTAGSIGLATQIVGSTVTFLGKLAIVLLFAFFMVSERTTMGRWVKNFIPRKYLPYCERKYAEIDTALGNWLRGQMILGLVIGTMVTIMLTIIGVPNALTLGILAGCLEFIPNVGPVLSAVPGVLIATAHGGPSMGLIVGLCYYGIQVLENNFIVPMVMQRSLNISPVASIFAMLVGISFPQIIHPVIGILLSIPLASIVGIFLNDLREWQTRDIRSPSPAS